MDAVRTDADPKKRDAGENREECADRAEGIAVHAPLPADQDQKEDEKAPRRRECSRFRPPQMIQHHDEIRGRQKPRRGEKRPGKRQNSDQDQNRVTQKLQGARAAEFLFQTHVQNVLQNPERAENGAVKPAENQRQEEKRQDARQDPEGKRRNEPHQARAELELKQFHRGSPPEAGGDEAAEEQSGGKNP